MLYVSFDGREQSYTREEWDALTLAYATTVHKAQGSEYRAVIFIADGSQAMMLSRALVYTAITRAKELAVVVGELRALETGVRNRVEQRARCSLAARLSKSDRTG